MNMWQCAILFPAMWAMVLLQGCSNKEESQTSSGETGESSQSELDAAENLIAEYDKQISALKDLTKATDAKHIQVPNAPDACNKVYLATEALAVKWKTASDKVKDGEPTQGQEIAKKQNEFRDALHKIRLFQIRSEHCRQFNHFNYP